MDVVLSCVVEAVRKRKVLLAPHLCAHPCCGARLAGWPGRKLLEQAAPVRQYLELLSNACHSQHHPYRAAVSVVLGFFHSVEVPLLQGCQANYASHMTAAGLSGLKQSVAVQGCQATHASRRAAARHLLACRQLPARTQSLLYCGSYKAMYTPACRRQRWLLLHTGMFPTQCHLVLRAWPARQGTHGTASVAWCLS